jgi:ribose-phosphate pyrophosphokinase
MIRVKSILGTDFIDIKQNHFPDNTLCVKVDKNYFGGSKREIVYEWRYENDAELFTLICLRRHFNASRHILYMPYCPHARMDRVKNDSDVFTLKYFCEIINSIRFDEVQILDVHSNVASALLHHCKNISPSTQIMNAVDQCQAEVFFYPDEGAMKRYSDMVTGPYAFGIKRRRWDDGKILGLDVINAEAVKDKDVLIVDDICSRGGTFLHSARALKEAGAKNIYLYVSHLEKTVFDGELWKEIQENGLLKQIYTADPLFKVENSDVITVV